MKSLQCDLFFLSFHLEFSIVSYRDKSDINAYNDSIENDLYSQDYKLNGFCGKVSILRFHFFLIRHPESSFL